MTKPSDTFAKVTWEADDTPLSLRFNDPYFAREDGRAETRHVFISANGLPDRWLSRSEFTIAELGFGSGLNFLETLATFYSAGGACRHLTFVSFERYPMTADDLVRALKPWPNLQSLARPLLEHWPPPAGPSIHRITYERATLEIHLGDANDTLHQWQGMADAWYLDGFSPAKNPELWNGELMRIVFDHTVNGGTFATYTAAGFVRRNLIDAGFDVHKFSGYGRKRESLAGSRPNIQEL